MGILSGLFSAGVGEVVGKVGEAVDSLVTSDEERLKLKNELVKVQLDAQQKADETSLAYENEVTERWKSDNEHIVTRLIRPLSFAWVIILFTAIVLGDGNLGFVVKDAYIPVIETLLTTMTIALFGSRGIEKVSRVIKKG